MNAVYRRNHQSCMYVEYYLNSFIVLYLHTKSVGGSLRNRNKKHLIFCKFKRVLKIYWIISNSSTPIQSRLFFRNASTFFLSVFMLPAKNATMMAITESTNSNNDHLKINVKTNGTRTAINKTPSLGPKLI